jgi:hypothetical protein
MWIWNKAIKPALDAFGHYETASAIAKLIWPLLLAAAAVMSGVFGQVPIMWIIMAATLTFMGAATGILNISLYRERKNPENKLIPRNTIFNHDLGPVHQQNRKTRQGMAKTGLVVPGPPRHLLKGQLGVEIVNTASFPISIFIESAETSIEDKKPGRTKYPREPIIVQPSQVFWLHDDVIPLDLPCRVINGDMKIVAKYGLPGREKYTLTYEGTVEAFFEPTGFLKGVYFHPRRG